MTVTVRHYYRPNGRHQDEETDLPDDCAPFYEAMQKFGCRLTAEAMGNLVSICIEDDEQDFDLDITVNGPEVQLGYAKMLKRFTIERAQKMRRQWRKMNKEKA